MSSSPLKFRVDLDLQGDYTPKKKTNTSMMKSASGQKSLHESSVINSRRSDGASVITSRSGVSGGAGGKAKRTKTFTKDGSAADVGRGKSGGMQAISEESARSGLKFKSARKG